ETCIISYIWVNAMARLIRRELVWRQQKRWMVFGKGATVLFCCREKRAHGMITVRRTPHFYRATMVSFGCTTNLGIQRNTCVIRGPSGGIENMGWLRRIILWGPTTRSRNGQ